MFGERYVLDVEIETATAAAAVRTAWIVRAGEAFPRYNLLRSVMRSLPTLHTLDTVALVEDNTEHGLMRGQVGTLVAELAPDVFEVEFADQQGRPYALVPLRVEQLLPLRFSPAEAA